jgi:hypothetical protein
MRRIRLLCSTWHSTKYCRFLQQHAFFNSILICTFVSSHKFKHCLPVKAEKALRHRVENNCKPMCWQKVKNRRCIELFVALHDDYSFVLLAFSDIDIDILLLCDDNRVLTKQCVTCNNTCRTFLN